MTPRALRLTPTLKATRALLHAALVVEVSTHKEETPCVQMPGGLDWLNPNDEVQAAAAVLCAQCPALKACRAYVSGYPHEPGVWAGTTEQDREQRSEAARAAQQTRRAAS